ncbi:hypothetical protein M413DRAFT_276155 [Hebeloma cylindrosporum]|uniref:Uncharacterized protein n=1 Tax=Hebeloma cylindrosporum TaxID=76867 RepID=A0A0C2XHC0_HEBCY|nr:hypothetical protein M413DRAFT_276155 [Hebeloma cylindrosporum h7]
MLSWTEIRRGRGGLHQTTEEGLQREVLVRLHRNCQSVRRAVIESSRSGPATSLHILVLAIYRYLAPIALLSNGQNVHNVHNVLGSSVVVVEGEIMQLARDHQRLTV